jgi:hypothetical protein
MATLTSDQAFELAHQFHDLSVALGNYRFGHWAAITPARRKQLEDLQFWILDYSSKFNALSIQIAIDDLTPTLDNIRKATDAMERSIEKIKQVEHIIRIGTAAVTLGAAVLSMNPQAIGTAIAGAVKVSGIKGLDI